MKIQRVLSESCYILHRRLYRETSLILEIFSQHYGRVSLLAKGVRNKSAKNTCILQPFSQYSFSWCGRGELYTLINAENQTRSHLFSSYQLCCGLYANELLLRVLQREDPHVELYQAYAKLLQDLQTYPKADIPLRIFEKKLLQNLGYGFSFNQIDPQKFYIFHQTEGLISVSHKTQASISGESITALENHDLQEKHLQDIKKLMRLALFSLVGEKPLKSRELFI